MKSIAEQVHNQILDQGPDTLWGLEDFPKLSQWAVAQALSRLMKIGILIRIRKGIYYYPKNTALGLSRPSAGALLTKALKKKHDRIVFSGGTASFQNLGITNQIPTMYTLLSNQASRKLQIGNVTAKI